MGRCCTGANAEPLATQSYWKSTAAKIALSKVVQGAGQENFGTSTQTELDWAGRAVYTATTKGLLPDSDVATSRHRYDELGRLWWSEDEWATRTLYQYDEASRLTGRSENRVAGASSVDDLNITYAYDRDGLPTHLIDPELHETSSTYDVLGRKRTQTTVGPEGQPQTDTFTYDTLDRLILRANGEGFWQYAPLPGRRRISTAAYRNMGVGLLGPFTTELRFTYDGLGHIKKASRTERNQEVHTTREYDGLGRVIGEVTDLGDAQYGVSFDFAAEGRLSNLLAYELTDPSSGAVRDDVSLSFAYDGVLQTSITSNSPSTA